MPLPKNEQYLFPATDLFASGPFCETQVFIHKNYEIGMHVHDFYEMNFVVAGEGDHYIGERCLAVGSGDVFVIPPMVPHGYTGHGLDVFHILIHTSLIDRHREAWRQTPGFSTLFEIEPYLRQTGSDAFFLRLGTRELIAVQQELERLSQKEDSAFFFYRTVAVSRLIAELCLDISRQTSGSLRAGDGDILQVLEYIQRNLGERLTLQQLSEQAHMSRATFSRRFGAITGVSPLVYVQQCRLKQAEELLSQGELSKTEVALRCGFYDAAHLNKYLHRKPLRV